MKKLITLTEIFADDDLGLLEIIPKKSNIMSTDERLISSFEEINIFVKENKREPQEGANIQEHKLASRLKSIRSDSQKTQELLSFDVYKLLQFVHTPIQSIDDIFESDDLDILDNIGSDEKLFELKNIPEHKTINSADEKAMRKKCKNFEEYENLFISCQKELSEGKRILSEFNVEAEIKEGQFFIINGILTYIKTLGKSYIDKHGKLNGEQYCIFENGTESKMLLKSLIRRLQDNGKTVSENIETDEKAVLENFSGITANDTKTGFIYVLQSLSTDEKISSLENLYKIGFSSESVEERIKNAKKDSTYLMAPVKIVTTFECYNSNPQKFEKLLHTFFAQSCLNIDIFDKKGKRYSPREWFIVPLSTIEKVITLIISGEIVHYRYDSFHDVIIKKGK